VTVYLLIVLYGKEDSRMPALRGGVIVEATSVPFGGLWPNASTITSILESEPLPGRCGHGTQLPSVVSSVGRFPPVPAVGFHVSLPHRPGGTLFYCNGRETQTSSAPVITSVSVTDVFPMAESTD